MQRVQRASTGRPGHGRLSSHQQAGKAAKQRVSRGLAARSFLPSLSLRLRVLIQSRYYSLAVTSREQQARASRALKDDAMRALRPQVCAQPGRKRSATTIQCSSHGSARPGPRRASAPAPAAAAIDAAAPPQTCVTTPVAPSPPPPPAAAGVNVVTPQMLMDVKRLLGSLYEEYDYEVDAAWVSFPRLDGRCVGVENSGGGKQSFGLPPRNRLLPSPFPLRPKQIHTRRSRVRFPRSCTAHTSETGPGCRCVRLGAVDRWFPSIDVPATPTDPAPFQTHQ
jgi:hypothetical protein